MCVRDGETAGPLGNTLEVTGRMGSSEGAPTCRGVEDAGMSENAAVRCRGGDKAVVIDLKRQLTEVAAASLALPGPLSSQPPSEAQNHLVSMQGAPRRDSGPDGTSSPDKMREKREREGRENLRMEEDGSPLLR